MGDGIGWCDSTEQNGCGLQRLKRDACLERVDDVGLHRPPFPPRFSRGFAFRSGWLNRVH